MNPGVCGILGIATVRDRRVELDDLSIERMRDAMAHRGPDGVGLARRGNVVLAHRRLVVIDPSPTGVQPMATGDGRFAIVYNGELYNDAELRRELGAAGVAFRGPSDSETVLRALAEWGVAGLPHLRGMYAIGLHDAATHTMLLARDPLGIKPLYYWLGRVDGTSTLIFASEAQAILAHPEVRARPDLATVSAYLTTIRTTLGERTMFDGIRTLRPGQALRFDLFGETISVTDVTPKRARSGVVDIPAAQVKEALVDSVARHLRSDVPICCLLSGGLDSSIVASVSAGRVRELHTYCSGARQGTDDGDFGFARTVAAKLGTRHVEAPITREMFAERWPEMVGAMGLPLSTPNEVAINEVSRRLRADGKIVTLSGEGADELFAGYEEPMKQAAAFEAGLPARCETVRLRARFQIDSNSWIGIAAKRGILNPEVARAIEGDHVLLETYERDFEAVSDERDDPDPMQAHLRFHRRVNLTGLLARLDTATMLAGVEGRTPFADRVIAELAEGLPMEAKFRSAGGAGHGSTAASAPVETKRILREAFAADLPPEVVRRPKASFPLPFQEWIADNAAALRESVLSRELFTTAAIESACAKPAELWQCAWPMVNVALWGMRWWG